MPTEMEDYLFDLQGYLILPQAVDADHLSEMNAVIDQWLTAADARWREKARQSDPPFSASFDNVVERDPSFLSLVNHPAWAQHLKRYIGGEDPPVTEGTHYPADAKRTGDSPVLEGATASIRGPGVATRLHSGAHKRRMYTQFRFHNNRFRCGEINIILALNDIGPGDGPTMVVPGSHKSNLLHPAFSGPTFVEGGSLDGMEAAVEVELNAGDAVLFVDCIAHGSARRINPEVRRVLIYRWGPHWKVYQPPADFLASLSEEQQSWFYCP